MAQQKDKYAVLFGKHNSRMRKPPSNVVRMFLDKDGNYYPDISISRRSLRKSNSSLRQWYADHTDRFEELCKKYSIGEGSFDKRLELLNAAIAKEIADRINTRSKEYDVVDVSIHGFRKKAYGISLGNRRSVGDNRKLEAAIDRYSTKKHFYTEVYWDSKYLGPLEMIRKDKGYHVFAEQGIPAALRVGLAARRVVSNIKRQRINIITHSLGAVVGAELLFNADTSEPALQSRLRTPAQPDVRTCLIAPATSPYLFRNYDDRGPRKAPVPDNYSMAVVYNTNDFVLNKNLQLLFLHIGRNTADSISSTTLGCNCGSAIDTIAQYVSPGRFTAFDMSLKRKSKRKCHYLNHCYIRNKRAFRNVVATFLDK
ncbi:hypothetical protein GCM10023093_16600 [Nemorincola caseinilytica]|uniref:Alpha/beta hydrolase n=2 Tax=Nemorincola caseinilytica TaxID=2054315 RepID=A0ABP8NCR2_9BACT